MDLQHLSYFVAVADQMNFRRAAERLGVTQPTVTKRIAALEEGLGLDLFVRGENRILGLTEAGKHYLEDARRVLAEIENATRAARAIAEGKAGRLRLGVCEDTASGRLARTVAEFETRFPDVGIGMIELPSARLVNGLHKGEIDLGLIIPPIDDRFLTVEPLWLDEWLVVIPAGHVLAQKERITVVDLRDVPLIVSDPQLVPSAHERIRDALQSAGVAPQVKLLALRRSTMLFLVAAGAGVTFIPASFSGALVPGTVARPFAIEPLTVAAAYRANDPPGLAMQFLRVAKASFEEDR